MLIGLDRRRLARVAKGALDEAALYGRERFAARRLPAEILPGPLACPLCGTRAKAFLPFGIAGRPNARCPGCGSLERHRFLWLYLQRRTDLFAPHPGEAPLRLLHVAPEPFVAERLAALPQLDCVTLDPFDPAASINASLTALPFAEASFDRALCSHVLEHIRDDRAAMAELARVLKPGGWAIVLVPYDPGVPRSPEGRDIDDPAERLARFGHPFHFRWYGADLVERLTAAGFRVAAVDSTRFLTPAERRRYRINRNFLFRCERVG